MAKRRRKNGRKAKAEARLEHQLPDGFWHQAMAVLFGLVLAPLIAVAIFGIGGPLPEAILNAAKWLVGAVAYPLPILLILVAVKVLRSEEGRVSSRFFIGLGVLVLSIAGLSHLFVERSLALDEARLGNGGGMLGFLITEALLKVMAPYLAAIVFISIAVIALLFVLQVSPKALLENLAALFRRERDETELIPRGEEAQEVEGYGEFKLNEGVPVERSGQVTSFRNTAQKVADSDADPLTMASDPHWQFPSLDLLNKKQDEANAGDVKGNAAIIKETLGDFGVEVDMEGANIGPRVTQYTLKPHSGVRLTKITALENNLALNLAAESIRIEAPIPGKRAVGVEVPNYKSATVRLHSILDSQSWEDATPPLTFSIGKDISGEPVTHNLEKLPHMLIAGQTGSGKSVMINSFLTSLLYRNSPATLRLILVDPKRVELAPYNDIPHLLTPVITEPEKCISALKWAVAEMERRYNRLSEAGARDIAGYNKVKKEQGMPYIVIVIDELADLMMLAARDVESLVVRLAQKARAVGLHLVLATQRPSVNVITGLIKANIPARIAFTVASQVDSRTIIDQAGAEKLLGQGDMLLLTPELSKPRRIQAAFIDEKEVNAVASFLRDQRPPEYDDEIIAQPVQLGGKGALAGSDGGADDTLYEEAVNAVIESGKASTTLLQLRFRIGYSRAARLMQMMEERGIIGPAQGSRPRDVLVQSADEVFNEATEETAAE